jgi:hypothetical protein
MAKFTFSNKNITITINGVDAYYSKIFLKEKGVQSHDTLTYKGWVEEVYFGDTFISPENPKTKKNLLSLIKGKKFRNLYWKYCASKMAHETKESKIKAYDNMLKKLEIALSI